MATRRRKTKMIPPDYSIGKNVFPIVPFRTRFGDYNTAAAFAGVASVIDTNEASIIAGNVGKEVQLDLDFESNEVFDVMMIDVKYEIRPSQTQATNGGDGVVILALTDDPDKATVTPIHRETVFETDETFIWFDIQAYDKPLASDAIDYFKTSFESRIILEQPWTVARNMKWIQAQFSTAAGDFAVNTLIQMWGRRRNASDDEFKAIIYRQRF